MPEINTLKELLIDELRDIYHAEKQITKALPKMIKKASSEELSAAFEKHLEETEGQVGRLEECFELLGVPAKAKPCEAMKGIIEEASEEMGEDMTDEVMDAVLVACAQKVEHYEIASYGTVIAWATGLGLNDVAELLQATLDEEKATDESLTDLAEETINPAAFTSEGDDEEDEDDEEDSDAKAAVAKKPAAKGRSQKRAS